MKKREDFTRRQAALQQFLATEHSDPPATTVEKMDRMVATYCAPYYEHSLAYTRMTILWNDILANFRAIGPKPEVLRVLVVFYIDFVFKMMLNFSYGHRDIPENFVFISYPGAPPEKPEYEYDP